MFRKHFNATTAIAIVAMIFAMTGGAFAVTSKGGGSSVAMAAKSKSKSKTTRGPAGPRGPEGKQGPLGPAGPTGPEGKAGINGKNGENGKAGENGVSATAKSFTGAKTLGSEKCAEGGLEVTSAAGTTLVCNGTNGTTGFTKTLPAGETEEGTWGTVLGEGIPHGDKDSTSYGFAAISFDIPLATALPEASIKIEPQGYSGTEAECPGKDSEPKAAAGYLCVYTQEEVGEPKTGISSTTAGGVLVGLAASNDIEEEENFSGYPASGTWAVTAPR